MVPDYNDMTVANLSVNRFLQAKLGYGDLVLGLSQFLTLSQMFQRLIMLALKVVKIDLKMIILTSQSKSMIDEILIRTKNDFTKTNTPFANVE